MVKFDYKTILTISILIVFFNVSTYLSMTLSDSYQAAKNYVETNDRIVKEVGNLKNSRIKVFGKSKSSTNSAQYEILIEGSKKGTVNIYLIYEGRWKVTEAVLIKGENKNINLFENM